MVVVLDEDGRIVESNASWQRFARNHGLDCADKAIGSDWLSARGLAGPTKNAATESIATGLADVLARRKDRFETVYPVSGREREVWLICQITPFDDEGCGRALVTETDVTDIKNAERGLAEKSALLARTLDNIRQGISLCDGRLNMLAFNRRFLETLEFPPEEFKPGDPFEKFIRYNAQRGEYGPGDVETLVRDRIELAKKFEPHSFERTRPDGTVIEIEGTPLPEGGFVTTYTDITERRHHEERVRQTEALLQRIAENMPGVIYRRVLHPDGRITMPYCSEGIRDLQGIDPEAIMNGAASPNDLVHPDDRERWHSGIMESAENMSKLDIEFRVLATDGSVKWVRSIAQPHKQPNGDIVWDGLSLDISIQKWSQEAIRQSEQRFRDVADVASDWIWETDADLRFTYLSGRWQTITGLEPATVVGKTRRDLGWADKDEEKWQEHLKDLDARRPFRDFQYTYVGPDGRVRHWSIAGTPVFGEDGTFKGYRGTGTDVTAVVEAAKAEHNAREQAEIANRSKSEFLATMSHELRTPLNAILGFSEVIQHEMFGSVGCPEYKEYAQGIHESGQHLLSLINEVLDLSKIEAGQFKLSEETFPISEIIESCVRVVRKGIDSSRHLLELSVSADIPMVRADPRAIRQILINLLANAVKFTPQGGMISLSARCNNSGDLEIVFKDTGIGIAEKDLALVLEPFQQVEGPLNRKHKGTGLGLPIVQSLVELHGGTLALESEVGEGTTVVVTLPSERLHRQDIAVGG